MQEIREAIGDTEGRMMQSEVVAAVIELATFFRLHNSKVLIKGSAN